MRSNDLRKSKKIIKSRKNGKIYEKREKKVEFIVVGKGIASHTLSLFLFVFLAKKTRIIVESV